MSNFAWRLGVRSIPQHKRRNLATAAAIAFGYIALILIAGYNVRVNDYMTISTIFLQHSGHIAIFKDDGLRKRFVKPKAYSLKPKEVERILAYFQTVPEYDFSVPYLMANGLVGNGCHSFPFLGRGYDPASEAKLRSHPMTRAIVSDEKAVLKGTPIWSNLALENQISLGKGLANKLGKSRVFEKEPLNDNALFDCKAEDIKSRQERDRNLQFVGLSYDKRLAAADGEISSLFSTGFSVTEDLAVEAPLKFMQGLLDTDNISYLAVFLKPADMDKTQLSKLKQKVNRDLRGQGVAIDAYAWNDPRFNPDYVDGLAVLRVTVGFVALIILFVVLLSIVNTLSIGLAESRRDIGTLRSIGYNPSAISKIYAVEAMIITITSVLLSAAVAHGLTQLIASLNIPFQLPGLSNATTFQLTPTLNDYLIAGVGTCILVYAVTVITAKRYARQDVLTLLDPGE